MGGCWDFSLVEWKLRLLRRHYRACGLKSELIPIDNDTTLHCWTPTPPIAEAGVWSVPNTKPALLLLHGFAPNAMLCWENQVVTFARDYNVYVPDLLFFGDSVTESKQRSESFQAECVAKMLQMLGVQNEVDVVGTSYGGMVAFRMAQQYPEFVNKLVICSSGICMSPDNNEPLLKKHGMLHISQMLVPEKVSDLRAAVASATFKTPWLPEFVCRDILKVKSLAQPLF
jgi:pimeloyl-ACP methyl ester carboxylesterase